MTTERRQRIRRTLDAVVKGRGRRGRTVSATVEGGEVSVTLEGVRVTAKVSEFAVADLMDASLLAWELLTMREDNRET